MTDRLDFEFVGLAACRDKRVNNCPEVATNIPGIVALRDTERPDTIVTMTPESWKAFTAAIRAGEFDVSLSA